MVVEGGRATGVEVGGETVHADTVVVAGGALNTPQILRRSGLDAPAIGKFLGLHPVRLVYGLFDEPQDAHITYPISSHFMGHQHDEDGGFVIEASTIQDPIAFATTMRDENGPMWGPRLTDALRKFRYWNGVLAIVNDENNASVVIDENGLERFDLAFNERELGRLRRGPRVQQTGARGGGRAGDRAGPALPRPTCRGHAGWATTPSAPPPTATGRCTASRVSTSATAR